MWESAPTNFFLETHPRWANLYSKDNVFVGFSQSGNSFPSAVGGSGKFWGSGPRRLVPFIVIRPVYQFSFNADGLALVWAGFDGVATSGGLHAAVTKLLTLKGHWGSIIRHRVQPGGRQIVTVGVDGRAIIWEFSTGQRLRTFAWSSKWYIESRLQPGWHTNCDLQW